jgi:hypothetical protein
MSLKQWGQAPRPKTEEVEAFWHEHGGRPETGLSLNDDEVVGQLCIDDEEEETFRRYDTPSGRLDGSIWLAWQEMEGDTDGSGEIAMHVGELDPEPTRLEPLGTFINEPVEGDVLIKTSRIPVFASGYGQNIGPSLSGHCLWEFEVIRRDMAMNLGLVMPSAFEGELDRRWDAKCFSSQAFFWAVTAGVLMNGHSIVKTLPTKKVPYFHFNVGDKVMLDLKVDPRTLSAKVLRVDSEDSILTNLHSVKVRAIPDESRKTSTSIEEELPALYLPADRKVYEAEDWDFADRSFYIKMWKAPEPGDVLDFQYTGKLTLTLNGNFIGTIKGVPNEAVPGALLSGNGDMVRLRGVWSERDQQMIDTVRESTLELLGGQYCPDRLKNVITDKVFGLTDWTILKALRSCKYQAEKAFKDIRQYCDVHCDRLLDKKTSRNLADRAAEGMSAMKEDTSYSDGFFIKDDNHEDMRWNPRSVQQALKWRPSNHRQRQKM